jgi:hypothetical protein
MIRGIDVLSEEAGVLFLLARVSEDSEDIYGFEGGEQKNGGLGGRVEVPRRGWGRIK